MDEILTLSLTAIAQASPLLLTYVVGIVVALLLWHRGPRPCALTMTAMLLLLITTITQIFVISYVTRRGMHLGVEGMSRAALLQSAVAFTGSCLRGVAIAILLGAVFVGRGSKPI